MGLENAAFQRGGVMRVDHAQDRLIGGGARPELHAGNKAQQFFHRLAAAPAADDMGWLYGRGGQRADEQRSPGVEGDTLAFGFGRRVAEAVIADGPQAAR